MKTAEDIIAYLESEKAHCLELHESYIETDKALALQYIISAVTIEGLLAEIKK